MPYKDQLTFFQAYFEKIKEKYGEKKFFLSGISLGALLASGIAMEEFGKEQIKALLLIVPFYEPIAAMKTKMERVAPIANFVSWFAPRMIMTEIDHTNQAFYSVHFNKDPKAIKKIAALTIASNYYMTEEKKKEGGKIDLPVIMIQAEKEHVVSNEAAQAFLKDINTENKELHEIKGADHGILNDRLNHEELLTLIDNFISKLI